MTGKTFTEDPHPELPRCFQDSKRVAELVQDIHGGRVTSAESGEPGPEITLEEITSGSEGSPKERERWQPQRVFRTCVATLRDVHGFGPLVAAEAQKRGFYQAQRQVFVADGQEANWTVHRLYFPNFTAVTDFMSSQWVGFMPDGHVVLKNVMFAPLVLEGKTVGIIGLANKDTDFDNNDAKMASGFGELAAIALQNSRNLDKRIYAEKQREIVIDDLKNALAHVKRLSGLLPICMHCKKIRDDKGYWNQLESYIEDNSDAGFSHGICDECLEKYYPESNLGED